MLIFVKYAGCRISRSITFIQLYKKMHTL